MDRSIRRLEAEEQAAIAYQDAYAAIEERLRAEYEAEFGAAFREKFPFKPNGQVIHALAMQQIAAPHN